MKKTQSGLKRSMPAALLSGKIFFPATAALFLLLVIAPGTSSSEEGRASESPHDFSRKELCSVCHKAEIRSLTSTRSPPARSAIRETSGTTR